MDHTTLGRTGLRVSRMGLGCGGHSRLGLSQGRTEQEAEQIVRKALDLGVNFIDTAESYRTERVVGRAIAQVPRDQLIISTKAGVDWQNRRSTEQEMKDRVHACLQRLNTDYVDVFHLHGVTVDEYANGRDELVPALQLLKQEGKIRFIGITEQFITDPSHQMLQTALKDDCWDVVMVGFNMLNQSARRTVLPITQEKNIGTLCMFAVRRALSRPEALKQLITDLENQHLIKDIDPDDPLGFTWRNGVAENLQEAAYRYCRWEPGLDVILSGTGDEKHLETNARSINSGPLPSPVRERLEKSFGALDSISGN